jgi:hypothetical protein
MGIFSFVKAGKKTFDIVKPKIAKNLAERRKTQDEVFKSIDEKGKGLSLQQRSNIKKSFSGKASKIYDKSSKARKGKMGGGMMGRRMGYSEGTLKPVDPKKQKGLSKLPKQVRNKMGYMKKGGRV